VLSYCDYTDLKLETHTVAIKDVHVNEQKKTDVPFLRSFSVARITPEFHIHARDGNL